MATALINTGVEFPDATVQTSAATGLPTGTLMLWSTASAPSGHLLCDGAAVSRTTYATLFGVIGTTFGAGDGSTTFNVPNFTDRFSIGTSGSYPVASTGGSADAITVSHSHTLGAGSVASTTGQTGIWRSGKPRAASGIVSFPTGVAGGADGSQPTGNQSSLNADHSHTLSGNTGSAGSSGTGANLPPYISLYFIIKT